MSENISCDVESCRHFKDSLCELSNIKVGAINNVTSGMAEDETLCSSYQKREGYGDEADGFDSSRNRGTVNNGTL
jgi:hypothetical protein